ncbi:MAG: hypothetical protein QG579_235, partial [Patescibacteria group bacterium]|nr:hypothetical protein [Patescibacteria group bacterium]
DEATPLSGTPTIKLSVAGTASTTVNLSSGDFTFSSLPVEPTPGDVITIWTDGGSDRATLVFKYGSVCEGGTTDCVGLSLYKDNVIIGVDYNNTLASTTIADLAVCDNDSGAECSDIDIGFTSNSGVLVTTWATNTLRLKDANARFSPGGGVTVSGLKISAGAFDSSGISNWYSSSWLYRKAITIDNTKVSGSADLTGFPILIDITDAGLAANAQADGDDILFTSSDGITKLNHEIEIYASATGRLTAWASTTLDFDNDTVIYMYYGNSGAANQQNATGVWDSNYKGVWHLPNGTTLTANDSTSNGKTGTVNSATATSSRLYGGANFNGNLSVNIAIPATTLGYSNFTVSGWARVSTQACGSSYRGLVSKNGYADFVLAMQCASGNIAFYASGGGGGSGTIVSTTSIGNGDWHYVNATCDGSFCRVYVDDGAAEASVGFGANVYDNAVVTTFGKYSNDTQTAFDGGLDEIRISSVARSVDWINTEYNNQSATSTFYAIGTQESPNSSNWYDEAYTKRKSHVITGSVGAGTNYQVKIIAYKATGTDSGGTVYLGTGIQDDFDDVRFTDNDGITPLDFWIASTTSGVSAEFWVEVQDTLESNATIYTYYQNTSATSGANGNNTFLFFDDFSGASLDLDKWTAFNVDSTSQSGGILSINNTIKDPSKVIADLNGGGQTGSNVAMRARYRITGGSHSDQRIGLSVKTDVANGQSYNYVMHDFANKDERQFLDDSIAWGTSNAEPFASNTWYIEEIYHSGTAVVARYDDGTWYSWTRSGRSGYLALNPGGYSDVVSSDWDYAFIRKIVSTEPTHGTWGEEELSAIDISLYGPLNISGGTFISTGSNLNFVGDSAQTITNSGGTVTLGPVIINKTNNSDTVTLASHLTLGDTLTITKGLLSQGSSYSLTTGGLLMVDTNGTLRNRGTGDLTLGGDVTNTGTIIMNSNNGTQCVDGENDIAIMSSSNGVQRTWSGAGTFTVYNVAVTDMLDSGITITAYNSTLTNSDWAVGGGCASYGGGGGGVFSSAELPGGGGTLVTGGDEGGGGGSSVVGITFDSSSASAHHTNGSPITWNHTVGSGTNTLLIVGCSIYSESSQPTATVATFNNVGMTKIRADQTPASLGYIETSIWFLHAPASGTHEVSLTVTFSGINNGGGCVSASYAGAQQVDTADASSGLTGTGTGSKSFTVTTVADNAWVFAVGGNKAGPGIAITAEQTSRGSITGTPRPNAEDTNAAVTPSGGVTMGFTISGLSAYWSMTGASFAPAAGSSESGSGGGTLQTGGGSGGGGSAAP